MRAEHSVQCAWFRHTRTYHTHL